MSSTPFCSPRRFGESEAHFPRSVVILGRFLTNRRRDATLIGVE